MVADWIDGLPGGTDVESGGGAAALTAIAASINSTTIRVTFSVPMSNNQALVNPGSYSSTPSLSILAATPEGIPNPNYVDLTTSEQKQGESYVVDIHIIEAV